MRLLIQRVWVVPGQSLDFEAVAMPALWVSLPSGETRWAEAGKASSCEPSFQNSRSDGACLPFKQTPQLIDHIRHSTDRAAAYEPAW